MSAPLSPGRLQNAAHYYTAYAVVLPHGISLDEALKPDFWAHCQKLRQHDLIRVIPEDATYFAELLVLAAGRGFAKVKLLREVKLTDEEVKGSDVPDGITVIWRGPHSKWCIERAKGDKARLREGLVEKADALREAAGYKDAA